MLFLRVWSVSLLKTLWEKENLLVTSNFFFSHSIFYPFWDLSAIFIKFKIVISKLFQFGKGLTTVFLAFSQLYSTHEQTQVFLSRATENFSKMHWRWGAKNHWQESLAATGRYQTTLLHYGSLPFTSVVGSESRPSWRKIYVTWPQLIFV